jgi:hypothetical protein
LDVLREMESEVGTLVSRLTELTDSQSTKYDIYLDCFEDTLEEARSMQVVLKDAIAKNIAKNTPAPSREFKSYRANPLESMHDVTLRNQSILNDLRKATHLFDQWTENTEEEDIKPLRTDSSSELHDHYENIRWINDWFVAEVWAETFGPEGYPLHFLEELIVEINALEAQLAKLTDPESVMYGVYTDYLETTLAQVRTIQHLVADQIFLQKL